MMGKAVEVNDLELLRENAWKIRERLWLLEAAIEAGKWEKAEELTNSLAEWAKMTGTLCKSQQ